MKFFCKITGFMCSLGMIFSLPAMASNVQEISWTNPTASNTDIICSKVSKNISRREERTVKETNFKGSLEKSDYKYIKVTKNISYSESDSKKPIAMACVEMNYRYNPVNLEAECISSFQNTVVYNSDYILNVSSKSLNKNIELGSNITFLNLQHINDDVYTEVAETDCNCYGEIFNSNV